jgi:hypothetical protein
MRPIAAFFKVEYVFYAINFYGNQSAIQLKIRPFHPENLQSIATTHDATLAKSVHPVATPVGFGSL